MGKRQEEVAFLELTYGMLENVNKDVDLFGGFYLECFREEAFEKIVARTRKRALTGGVALCLVALLFAAPMAINPSSIFAKIILAMGAVLFIAGAASFVLAVCAREYGARHFERLIEAEFAATRSSTKRIFDIRFSEESVTVLFGAQSSVKQVRTKRYEDISAVYEAADLIFIKGLTWLSRFQMGDEAFEAVCGVLKKKCLGKYRVCESFSSIGSKSTFDAIRQGTSAT